MLREHAEMAATEARLNEIIPEIKPDILHAHSPVLNAIPAIRAGRDIRERHRLAHAAGALHGRQGGPKWRRRGNFPKFFDLLNRSFSACEIVWSFYDGFDLAWCGDAFNEGVYVSNKARKLRQAVEAGSDRFTRGEVEALYPFYRCRYWMGRNNSVNNKLGTSLTPFIGANVVPAVLALPVKYKTPACSRRA